MTWRGWLRDLVGNVVPGGRRGRSGTVDPRGQLTHIIILDGTMSSLHPGCESSAGLAFKLLSEVGDPRVSLYYEAGLQWEDWRATGDVIMGRGLNRQIRRAYGYLASRYRPGDRIFLLGFSRGGFAVRSLAGVIDRVGLVKATGATERTVLLAYRHYQAGGDSKAAKSFRESCCHRDVQIEMIGAWDTVKALGLRLPVLWRFTERHHAFHNHALGANVRRGLHALALDETRAAFEPVLWEDTETHPGHVEQLWFKGTHGDIGGHLNGYEDARPLSNIPFRWIMGHVEGCGVRLPEGWRLRFPEDINAPSSGNWRGWGKLFLARKRRKTLREPSEALHMSVPMETRQKNTPMHQGRRHRGE